MKKWIAFLVYLIFSYSILDYIKSDKSPMKKKKEKKKKKKKEKKKKKKKKKGMEGNKCLGEEEWNEFEENFEFCFGKTEQVTFFIKRVLQFFLILQNPPPPKVTKSTFYNISSSLLMLSASNCFWVR